MIGTILHSDPIINLQNTKMSLQKSLFKKSPGAVAPYELNHDESGDNLAPLPATMPNSTSSAPVAHSKWDDFFTSRLSLQNGQSEFNVFCIEPVNDTVPLYVFHHGAGSSAMTWAPVAKELQQVFNGDREEGHGCGVVAFDARGHGETRSPGKDFSMSRLVVDAVFVIQNMVRRFPKNPLFLVGHSLGGSVLTNAFDVLQSEGVRVAGLILLDIVEDTAIRSLAMMHIYLANLPKSFPTLQHAIDWNVQAGTPANRSSAVISIPPLFKQMDGKLVWVLDLKATEPYWEGWFRGLSKRFIDARTSKMLVLAGTDSLDKELMIGQMQGKYQLVVFQDSGHFIHEDVPRKTALTILEFYKRNNTQKRTIKSTWGSVQ